MKNLVLKRRIKPPGTFQSPGPTIFFQNCRLLEFFISTMCQVLRDFAIRNPETWPLLNKSLKLKCHKIHDIMDSFLDRQVENGSWGTMQFQSDNNKVMRKSWADTNTNNNQDGPCRVDLKWALKLPDSGRQTLQTVIQQKMVLLLSPSPTLKS